ncbi:MAG: hypothetical protein K6B38_13645 [Ruminococcus sp.]|nr:hypothetical protein [Ruminococcus sp.]
MSIIKKQHTLSIPEPFSAEDIKLESSICTGESTIGFYDKTLKRLVYAELVRSEKDIIDFYKKYGLSYKGESK